MSDSDKDDCFFKRGLTWLENTFHYKLVIAEIILPGVFTWIDAAYYVHRSMRIH